MAAKVDKVDVWRAFTKDKPGALARILGLLSRAGASLEFSFGRPAARGGAVVFLSPIKGSAQLKAAKALGMEKCTRMLSLRVKAPNRKGVGAKLTAALGEKGINLRGFTAVGLGKTALFYIALDKKDVPRAQKLLKAAL